MHHQQRRLHPQRRDGKQAVHHVDLKRVHRRAELF
jgi:hypothetical protein